MSRLRKKEVKGELKPQMSLKQKLFCDYYLESGKATQSALRAGYSPTNAHGQANANLSKPYIQEYLAERSKQIEDETIANATEIMAFLTATMRETITRMQEVKNKETGEIELKEVKVIIPMKTRIKAAELLGKRYQLFTDKLEITGTFTPIIIEGESEFDPSEDMIVED